MSIHLPDLISTLADACSRGCQVIQEVQQKREKASSSCVNNTGNDDADATGTSKSNNISVQYKVADDPRSALTEADLASQKVIVHCIRDVWGDDLKIIGEEDDDENTNTDADAKTNDEDITTLFEKYNVDLPTKRSIQKDLLKDAVGVKADPNPHHQVELNQLCLYIDPMDGTREFVEQRLHNVQCLIGITYMGHPIGGVIGLPFVSLREDGNDDNKGIINVVCALYSFDAKANIVDMIQFNEGTATLDGNEQSWLSLEKKKESVENSNTVVKVFTGDSERLPKKKALEYIDKLAATSNSANDNVSIELCIAGGCGNKILRTIASSVGNPNMNAIAVIPPGTCSWDTAASTAMLRASEVKYGIVSNVTDMFGGQLVYDSTGCKVTNDLGVFVSFGDVAAKYHIELCKAMRSDAMILDSLLRKYWTVSGDEIVMEEEVRIRLRNSQMKAQSVDTTRNAEGYVLTCKELENLVAEQVSFDSCKLIGYAMPERKDSGGATNGHSTEVDTVDESVQELQLFWNSSEKSLSKNPPDVVQLMTNGSKVRIALCE